MVDYAGRQPIIFRAPTSTLDAKTQADLAEAFAAASAASANNSAQYAGMAAAVAAGRYYASYSAGNAATTTGQYFAVFASGNYEFYLHGTGTPVFVMPKVNGSGGLSLAGPGDLGISMISPKAVGGVTLDGVNNAGGVTISYSWQSGGQGPLKFSNAGGEVARLTGVGQMAIGTLTPQKKFVVSNAGTNGLEVAPDEGDYTRLLSYNRNANWYTALYIEGDSVRILTGSSAANGWNFNAAGVFGPMTDNAFALGSGGLRPSVIYAASGTINTSDRDAKTDISAIPDEWLDAWADVEWVRFKFSDGTRWHTGLVAQQVHEAFAAHDLDAFDIGLCCFDEWDAAEEILNKDGRIIQPALEAGSRWGLRYSECEAMEAAYQRRRIAQLEAQVAAL